MSENKTFMDNIYTEKNGYYSDFTPLPDDNVSIQNENKYRINKDNYSNNYNNYNNARSNYGNQYNRGPYNNTQPANGLSIASLVLGIVGIICFMFPFPICSVLSIIFGGVAISKGNKSGMSTAGLVLGVIGTLLTIVFYVWFSSLF